MARPRVFVSSTFYDLKHIRASLEVFIESLGFDAVLFEKGDISFHPDVLLDESCYREAANADIFVLIIGGRYGSSVSGIGNKKKSPDSSLYESITKKEFETAQINDVPTFILLDSSVSAEYQTYLRNRGNSTVVYAHVDSEGVFKLLDAVFEKSKNNPVFNFDRATQIESWLREQWSGLFRELLKSRSQQKQLSALNSQVAELKSVNETLKTYLEAVLSSVKPEQSEQIIKDQDNKLTKLRIEMELEDNAFYRYLRNTLKLNEIIVREIISSPTNADETLASIDAAILASGKSDEINRNPIKDFGEAQDDFNKAREILNAPPIDFFECSDDSVSSTALDHSTRHFDSLDATSSKSERSIAVDRSEAVRRKLTRRKIHTIE